MKQLHVLCGLLLIGLLANCGLADISLRLRNSNAAASSQAYLPPPVQELPITTYNVEEASTHAEQHEFKESNYGNSKYQIFEVHNHYEPAGTQASYAAPGYLPPAQQEIHIQHINQAHAVGSDDNLDISFLTFDDNLNGEKVTITASAPTSSVVVPLPAGYDSDNYEQHTANNRRVKPLDEAVHTGVEYLAPSHQSAASRAQQTHLENYNTLEQHNVRESNYRATDYLPPTTAATASEYRGPDYLPPLHESQAAGHTAFKAPDYLPPVALGRPNAEQGLFKGPDYLPPPAYSRQSQSTFKGPDYLPPVSELQRPAQDSFQGPAYLPPTHGQQTAERTRYKGPDYLPPVQEQKYSDAHAAFKGPDYLPPAQEQGHSVRNSAFKGPEYLPPVQERGAVASHKPFKGPDYLPPVQEQANFKGQDYLPPTQDAHSESHANFKGPDYLPPSQEGHGVANTSFNGVDLPTFSAPEYLPPSSNQQQQQHQIASYHSHSTSSSFKGPDYLPPATHAPYKGPDYLPPPTQTASTQDYMANTAITAAPTAATSTAYQAPGYLPPGYDFAKPAEKQQTEQAYQQPVQQAAPQHALPDGYDFVKPVNAEEAIAQLHSQDPARQKHQEVTVQAQIQVSENNNVGDIIYGKPAVDIQHNGQLPSVPQPQGRSYEQSVSTTHQQQQQTQQYHSMHSLSSFMSSVQPYERYGNAQFTQPRRPFDQYGPPPSASSQSPQTEQQTIELAPMYREQNSRPQYYAPSMSYSANAVAPRYTTYTTKTPTPAANYGFNEQARQSLQNFMPRDAQQLNTAAPTTAVTSTQATAAAKGVGKIRTVQIINPNKVRTLRVLETSDQDGVKTIKILGSSNEQPTGEHRIVKVVTQNAQNANENHVQTVKIFNDHREVALSELAQIGATVATYADTNVDNGYLPPTVTTALAVARKRSVRRVSRQSERRRRRYK